MTKEQRHMQRVKELPCCLCGASAPSDAHHILEGRVKGRKAHDFCTIPLCKSCHQSDIGLHGDKSMLKIMKENELNLLGETLKKLYGKM